MRKCFQFGKLAKSFFFFIASPMREYSLLIELWNIFVIKKSLLEYNWLRKLRKKYSAILELDWILSDSLMFYTSFSAIYIINYQTFSVTFQFHSISRKFVSEFKVHPPISYKISIKLIFSLNRQFSLLLHSCRFRNHNKNRWHVKISNLTIWINSHSHYDTSHTSRVSHNSVVSWVRLLLFNVWRSLNDGQQREHFFCVIFTVGHKLNRRKPRVKAAQRKKNTKSRGDQRENKSFLIIS